MPNVKKAEFSDDNAKILADLIVDPQTTDYLRVKIIKEILASREGQTFFKTMFEEAMSAGECPECQHMNHWAIPEVDLNQMDWVTHLRDDRVPENTRTAEGSPEICDEWQEACKKKKVIL